MRFFKHKLKEAEINMKQIKRSGTKEFFITLLMLFIIITVTDYIKFILPSYKIAGDILRLIIICIYGFLILTHYSAVFTYDCTKTKVKVNRRIGKRRHKETEFSISSITDISDKKPDVKKIGNYNPKILKHKNTKYITYKKDKKLEAVLIEADDELINFLKNNK